MRAGNNRCVCGARTGPHLAAGKAGGSWQDGAQEVESKLGLDDREVAVLSDLPLPAIYPGCRDTQGACVYSLLCGWHAPGIAL